MIRLLAALGAFLFLSLWFLGDDHGQVIHAAKPHVTQAAAPAPERPVFIPAQPVMQPTAEMVPATPQALPVAEPALPEAAAPEATVAPVTQGRQMHSPGGASIRSGPGRTFSVIGTLAAGQSVLVLDEAFNADWYQVSVAGQTGWVAARLLRE